MPKEQYRATGETVEVRQMAFGILTPDEIGALSHIKCVNKNLYNPDQSKGRQASPYGVLDPKLGEISVHVTKMRPKMFFTFQLHIITFSERLAYGVSNLTNFFPQVLRAEQEFVKLAAKD